MTSRNLEEKDSWPDGYFGTVLEGPTLTSLHSMLQIKKIDVKSEIRRLENKAKKEAEAAAAANASTNDTHLSAPNRLIVALSEGSNVVSTNAAQLHDVESARPSKIPPEQVVILPSDNSTTNAEPSSEAVVDSSPDSHSKASSE